MRAERPGLVNGDRGGSWWAVDGAGGAARVRQRDDPRQILVRRAHLVSLTGHRGTRDPLTVQPMAIRPNRPSRCPVDGPGHGPRTPRVAAGHVPLTDRGTGAAPAPAVATGRVPLPTLARHHRAEPGASTPTRGSRCRSCPTTARPTPPSAHSAVLTDGPDRAGARGMLKAIGFTDEDLAKPIIGVATQWIETMPCNYNQRDLAVARQGGHPRGGRHAHGVQHHQRVATA